MKSTDKKELHGRTETELAKMLKDGYELLAMLRLDKAQHKLKNTRDLFHTRKKIAVIKSIMKAKEMKNA